MSGAISLGSQKLDLRDPTTNKTETYHVTIDEYKEVSTCQKVAEYIGVFLLITAVIGAIGAALSFAFCRNFADLETAIKGAEIGGAMAGGIGAGLGLMACLALRDGNRSYEQRMRSEKRYRVKIENERHGMNTTMRLATVQKMFAEKIIPPRD